MPRHSPDEVAARITAKVMMFLGHRLTVNLESEIAAHVFPILWEAQFDDDEIFFRSIGGLLVEVWTGHRVDGPEWVRNQPPGLFSPSK